MNPAASRILIFGTQSSIQQHPRLPVVSIAEEYGGRWRCGTCGSRSTRLLR
jgi:hypothetical protein